MTEVYIGYRKDRDIEYWIERLPNGFKLIHTQNPMYNNYGETVSTEYIKFPINQWTKDMLHLYFDGTEGLKKLYMLIPELIICD